MGNYIMCIETYFAMLRLNSHIQHHVPMWKEYRESIAIICTEYIYNKNPLFEFKLDYERQVGKEDNSGINFDPIALDAVPEDILINLFCSVRNMRVGIVVDQT